MATDKKQPPPPPPPPQGRSVKGSRDPVRIGDMFKPRPAPVPPKDKK
jgi:hypothetical protein